MGLAPRGIIGITGSPGTGKKTIAPLVASSLGLPCLGVNDFARSRGLIKGKGEAEIDTQALRKELARHLVSPSVVYGHLLPYTVSRRMISKAVVLRCEPSVLKERLGRRRYPSYKLLENVEAELIGTISAETRRAFGNAKTLEFDTTRSTPQGAAAGVLAALAARGRRAMTIDWLPGYDSGAKLMSLLSSG